jgi:hypothetical protein
MIKKKISQWATALNVQDTTTKLINKNAEKLSSCPWVEGDVLDKTLQSTNQKKKNSYPDLQILVQETIS